jgi:hypothetical protein
MGLHFFHFFIFTLFADFLVAASQLTLFSGGNVDQNVKIRVRGATETEKYLDVNATIK